MKKRFLLTCMLVLAGCAAPSFEDAQQAKQKGDFDGAAEIWGDLANEGDGRALFALYRLYSATGVGFRNDAEARAALRKVAEDHDDAAAQFVLAEILLEEREDLEEARQWLNRSADQGHPEAQRYRDEHGRLLGRMIQARRGSATQQYELGNALYFGNNGLKQDYVEAAIWYRKAAERGSADAQAMLGYQYLEGQGIPKNPAQAYAWYREAALQGHAAAQGYLSYLYGEGIGAEQDDIKAYAWAVLASENGYAEAEKNKAVYLERLSNQQRLRSLNEIRRLEALIQSD